MIKEKQIDIITDLLIDFDEMGFSPTILVPDPEAYAMEWRRKITNALKQFKADFVSEIFEEIEDVLNNIGYFDAIDYNELKKKYTEDNK